MIEAHCSPNATMSVAENGNPESGLAETLCEAGHWLRTPNKWALEIYGWRNRKCTTASG